MNASSRFHWVRALFGGFFAEAAVFAIVFPVLYFFGQRAFLASILVASALMPFVFALWVCRRVSSEFVWHGALVGITAAVIYLIVAHGQPEPFLYKVAHGFKVIGGIAGGLASSRQQRFGKSASVTSSSSPS